MRFDLFINLRFLRKAAPIAIIESSNSDPTIQQIESSLGALNGIAREKATLAAIPVFIRGVRGEILADMRPDQVRVVRGQFAAILGRIGPPAVEALPALKGHCVSAARQEPRPPGFLPCIGAVICSRDALPPVTCHHKNNRYS
jgi:hypothetical protein